MLPNLRSIIEQVHQKLGSIPNFSSPLYESRVARAKEIATRIGGAFGGFSLGDFLFGDIASIIRRKNKENEEYWKYMTSKYGGRKS